jgi:hypothetical protein
VHSGNKTKDYKSSEKEREQLEEAGDKFRTNLAKLEQTKKQLQHQVYITVMLAYFCIFHFWIYNHLCNHWLSPLKL